MSIRQGGCLLDQGGEGAKVHNKMCMDAQESVHLWNISKVPDFSVNLSCRQRDHACRVVPLTYLKMEIIVP
jgi:hypothetical protein